MMIADLRRHGFALLVQTDAGVRCAAKLLHGLSDRDRKKYVEAYQMPRASDWSAIDAFDPMGDDPLPPEVARMVRELVPRHKLYVKVWELLMDVLSEGRAHRAVAVADVTPKKARDALALELSDAGPGGPVDQGRFNAAGLQRYLAWSARAGCSHRDLSRIVTGEKRAYLAYREALNRLVESQMDLAENFASKLYPGLTGELAEGVRSQAHVALMLAAERMDLSKGAAFSSYAHFWIRDETRKYLQGELVWMGTTRDDADLAMSLYGVRANYEALHGHFPTAATCAELLDVPVSRVEDALRAMTPALSTDECLAGSDGEMTLGGTLGETPDYESAVDGVRREEAVRLAIGRLPAAEQEILTLRFGLGGSEPITINAAAKHMGLSRYKAQTLEQSAIRCLRLAAGVERPRFDLVA